MHQEYSRTTDMMQQAGKTVTTHSHIELSHNIWTFGEFLTAFCWELSGMTMGDKYRGLDYHWLEQVEFLMKKSLAKHMTLSDGKTDNQNKMMKWISQNGFRRTPESQYRKYRKSIRYKWRKTSEQHSLLRDTFGNAKLAHTHIHKRRHTCRHTRTHPHTQGG